MEKIQIKDIVILHESDGRVKQVLMKGEDLNNIFISFIYKIDNFDPFHPDNVEVSLSNEYEQLFQDLFNVIDELYSLKKGCLAGYLSSFLYERLTPIWNQILRNGQHILAIQFWRKIISITHEWEKINSKHVHKGTPYAFIAYTYFLIGDIDRGFSYIYNAIEEDVSLNSLCPQLNYPRSAPVYLTASLSSNPNNIMYPIVHEMRSELEVFLTSYRKSFNSEFDIKELDKKFLQNTEIDTIKYYFVLTYWNIFEYRRTVSSEMMKNEFSKLRNLDFIFSLCLVIDKLLNYKYKTVYISDGIKAYSRTNKLMTEQNLNSF